MSVAGCRFGMLWFWHAVRRRRLPGGSCARSVHRWLIHKKIYRLCCLSDGVGGAAGHQALHHAQQEGVLAAVLGGNAQCDSAAQLTAPPFYWLPPVLQPQTRRLVLFGTDHYADDDDAMQTAFIVEHDFIMAAYLADRVVVYDGVPSSEATAHCPQSLLTGELSASPLAPDSHRASADVGCRAVSLCTVTSDTTWHTALRLLSARVPRCMHGGTLETVARSCGPSAH
jgi:hypothetical protein